MDSQKEAQQDQEEVVMRVVEDVRPVETLVREVVDDGLMDSSEALVREMVEEVLNVQEGDEDEEQVRIRHTKSLAEF